MPFPTVELRKSEIDALIRRGGSLKLIELNPAANNPALHGHQLVKAVDRRLGLVVATELGVRGGEFRRWGPGALG